MCLCTFCGEKSQITCSRCEQAFCGTEHQRLHEFQDGSACYPFRIKESAEVGRFIVASKDILPGEVIFEEEVVVAGPNQETIPICLFCHEEVDCEFLCSSCGYPFCNDHCLTNCDHELECQILSVAHNKEKKNVFRPSVINRESYHVILPLRLLLSQQKKPYGYNMVNRLMDHNQERQKFPYWEESQVKVVDLIRNAHDQGNEIPEEKLHRIVGILEVNAYELYASATGAGFRGIFCVGSLLSHSCIANTTHMWSKSPPFVNKCIASVSIKQGTEICSKYVHPATGTWNRRQELKSGWFFECRCDRCADPTESGSSLSTIVCKTCQMEENDSQMSWALPKDPLSWFTNWICHTCGCEQNGLTVQEKMQSFLAKVMFEYVDVALALREKGETGLKLPDPFTLQSMAEESYHILSLENHLTPFEECIFYSLCMILKN
ncbi:hypothetical protein TCAL_06674 [Tigriopus californicus]|uniref:SET domain-containing protein n=1 Tax=Tigriopus californicus TaxID=6832 RepID=A0A553N8X5_TIGCA|nr:hypothetical protein TCAL_06674 [Tigriopus californicus]